MQLSKSTARYGKKDCALRFLISHSKMKKENYEILTEQQDTLLN
jgi:hypothetical protein